MYMKSKKSSLNITLLSIMLILICFCLCGCANVNFVTYHNNDGSIHEYVYLTIDEQLLQKHGYDVDEQQIRAAAKHIFDGGGQNLQSEYERDFYSQMEQLAGGAEIMGYKDGFDYVNDSMRLVQDGVVTPNKDYVQKHYGNLRASQQNNTLLLQYSFHREPLHRRLCYNLPHTSL